MPPLGTMATTGSRPRPQPEPEPQFEEASEEPKPELHLDREEQKRPRPQPEPEPEPEPEPFTSVERGDAKTTPILSNEKGCIGDFCAEFSCKVSTRLPRSRRRRDQLSQSAPLCAHLQNLGFDREISRGEGPSEIQDWHETFGRNVCCGKACGADTTLAVRGVFALTMASVWVWTQIDFMKERPDGSDADSAPDTYAYGYYWIYLTHITLTLQVIYHALAVALAVKAKNEAEGESAPADVPRLAKLTWFMQAVCLPSTFFVFVLYWGLVFDGELQAIACFTHGVNFAVMMADAYASGFPVLLAHALYFMIYAALYLCWTFVHYQSGVGNEKGEPYIYSAVNWAHPDAVKALAVSRILRTLRSIWPA